jgi:hypothetical protein
MGFYKKFLALGGHTPSFPERDAGITPIQRMAGAEDSPVFPMQTTSVLVEGHGAWGPGCLPRPL